jgi:cytochrome c-type biogenesis protein CcsB
MKKILYQVVPWCFLALFAAEIVAILIPKPDKDFAVQEFGRLPALSNGRVQPLDSVGRNALLQLRSTAAVPLEEVPSWKFWHHAQKLKATEWLMEATMKPEVADTRPIFLIHHPDLLNELDLRGKGKEKSGLFYFSFNELTNSLEKIQSEGRQVAGVDDKVRTAYQKQVAKLHNALGLYRQLKNTLQPEDTKDFAAEIQALRAARPPGLAAIQAQRAGQSFDKAALDTLAGLLQPYDTQSRLAYARIVPPGPGAPRDAWYNMGQAVFEAGVRGQELPQAAGWFARMSSAYTQNKPAEFNQAVTEYRDWLAANAPAELKKGRAEFFFNNLQAFLHAMIIYICAFVLAAGAMLTISVWPDGSEALRRSAFYLTVLALTVHTAGLLFRMWLEHRPPVTNLYSSAIFIGWAVAILGIVLERIYRVGIGVAASSLIGFVTLVIAHNLALGGDTMEMMRAVLDTNFWLATHVVTITLGYAATFMAGFLAIIYVLVGLSTPLLGYKLSQRAAEADSTQHATRNTPTLGQALGKMVYGIVCFATLFSFVGTVLGGIWADQSWGRFWGWDPKENGALLIVLWNAAILHALSGDWIRERGLMTMAIFGNIVTSFSWFGVNMLGIGLHSYGFMDAAFKWLMIFIFSQVVLISLGLLPLNLWASFRSNNPPSHPADSGAAPTPAPN